MTTIYKYPVPIHDEFIINMPNGAQPLSVRVQNGQVYMWAMVNPRNAMIEKRFYLRGTGHPIEVDDENLRFIDTFQIHDGSLVCHLFEDVEEKS